MKILLLIFTLTAPFVVFSQAAEVSPLTQASDLKVMTLYFKGPDAHAQCKDLNSQILDFDGKVQSSTIQANGYQINTTLTPAFEDDLWEYIQAQNLNVYRIYSMDGITYSESASGHISEMKQGELDKLTL